MTDPYSISKGFLFAHIGWMIQYYDEETKKEVDSTDVADLTSKPVLQIQKRNIILLWIVMSFIVPILIAKLWGETVTNTFFSSTIRTVLLWHGIWCVNSLAHMYGDRPYNGDIEPSENAFVSLVTLGEGWHNFHHTYPKDYRASEPGKYNPTTFFIDAMDYLGLVKNKHAACDKTVHVRGVGKFNKANYCVST
jgi:stearoyl-CoA desaturase (delta-9 desaturase)